MDIYDSQHVFNSCKEYIKMILKMKLNYILKKL